MNKLVHLFWSQRDGDPLTVFSFPNYLCIRTLLKTEQPTSIIIWTDRPSNSPWWNEAIRLPSVVVADAGKYTQNVDHKFVQHLSDYVRYRVLYEFGGMMIDFDTVSIKPLLPKLSGRDAVLIPDGNNPKYQSACLLARPHSKLVNKCVELSENAVKSDIYTTCGPEVVTEAARQITCDVELLPPTEIEQSVRIWSDCEVPDVSILHYCTMMWGYCACYLKPNIMHKTMYNRAVEKVLGKWGGFPDHPSVGNLYIPEDVIRELNSDQYVSVLITEHDSLWSLFEFEWKKVYYDPMNVVFREWCPDPNRIKPTLFVHCRKSVNINSTNIRPFTNMLADVSILS